MSKSNIEGMNKRRKKAKQFEITEISYLPFELTAKQNIIQKVESFLTQISINLNNFKQIKELEISSLEKHIESLKSLKKELLEQSNLYSERAKQIQDNIDNEIELITTKGIPFFENNAKILFEKHINLLKTTIKNELNEFSELKDYQITISRLISYLNKEKIDFNLKIDPEPFDRTAFFTKALLGSHIEQLRKQNQPVPQSKEDDHLILANAVGQLITDGVEVLKNIPENIVKTIHESNEQEIKKQIETNQKLLQVIESEYKHYSLLSAEIFKIKGLDTTHFKNHLDSLISHQFPYDTSLSIDELTQIKNELGQTKQKYKTLAAMAKRHFAQHIEKLKVRIDSELEEFNHRPDLSEDNPKLKNYLECLQEGSSNLKKYLEDSKKAFNTKIDSRAFEKTQAYITTELALLKKELVGLKVTLEFESDDLNWNYLRNFQITRNTFSTKQKPSSTKDSEESKAAIDENKSSFLNIINEHNKGLANQEVYENPTMQPISSREDLAEVKIINNFINKINELENVPNFIAILKVKLVTFRNNYIKDDSQTKDQLLNNTINLLKADLVENNLKQFSETNGGIFDDFIRFCSYFINEFIKIVTKENFPLKFFAAPAAENEVLKAAQTLEKKLNEVIEASEAAKVEPNGRACSN